MSSKAQIQVPLFLRVYHRRFQSLPPDRKTSTKRRLDWFVDDAFAEPNVRCWTPEQVIAWRCRETHVDAFYYQFKDPSEAVASSSVWSDAQHQAFMNRLALFASNAARADAAWGLFSRTVPGRVGRQCEAHYLSLLRSGTLSDPAYGHDEFV